MKAPRPRSGGQPRRPEPGERFPVSFRVTAEVKLKLDEAAKASGRSQSQEAETRLEQSFRNEEILLKCLDFAYGQDATAIAILIAHLIHVGAAQAEYAVSNETGSRPNWISDAYAFEQVSDTVRLLLASLAPEGDPRPPGSGSPARSAVEAVFRPSVDLGIRYARHELSALDHRRPPESLPHWARPIVERLEPAVIERLSKNLDAAAAALRAARESAEREEP